MTKPARRNLLTLPLLLLAVSATFAAFAASAAPVGSAVPSAASAPPAAAAPAALESRADEHYLAKDWPAAAADYAALVAGAADSGLFHFRLAVALLYLHHLERGTAELDAAEKAGWAAPAVAFRRACAASAAGQLERAEAELDKAAAAGFTQVSLLDDEPLLAALRTDARWPGVRRRIDSVAHPCRYDAKYRGFDFWLGEWDVRPAGVPDTSPNAAENIVTLEHDDCVLHEHWKSTGSNGESLNIYDASRDQWYQTWADNTGGLHDYHGNLDAHGNMVLLTDLQYTPGKERIPTRLTFFKLGPDRVRQLSEQSSDGGKTWTVNYDLIYLRRAAHAAK